MKLFYVVLIQCRFGFLSRLGLVSLSRLSWIIVGLMAYVHSIYEVVFWWFVASAVKLCLNLGL